MDPVDPSGRFDDFLFHSTSDGFLRTSLSSSFFAARAALIALELACSNLT